MNEPFRKMQDRIAAMFHGQVSDFFTVIAHGTFLTNPAQALVAPASRILRRRPCTELSTVDVDNGHFL
ncbi:hypothetical protein [Lysobacter sp. F60174L2]|uniref:hypothetical protein n=1 Tax=Lysobacter sp. F60174L2 TaxID=3459295 RepID=UPI00403D9DEF